MLLAVQKFAVEKNARAQLSVESYMGCGVGLCQGCVIERQNGQVMKHSYHEKYSLVCLDGPVYECDEIIFG
jgi:dihydroorotate dehydrogenase electron transfer subunit